MIQVDDITKVPIEFLRTREGEKILKIDTLDINVFYDLNILNENGYHFYYMLNGCFFKSGEESVNDILFDNIGYELWKILK
jgi:hypothetical protein